MGEISVYKECRVVGGGWLANPRPPQTPLLGPKGPRGRQRDGQYSNSSSSSPASSLVINPFFFSRYTQPSMDGKISNPLFAGPGLFLHLPLTFIPKSSNAFFSSASLNLLYAWPATYLVTHFATWSKGSTHFMEWRLPSELVSLLSNSSSNLFPIRCRGEGGVGPRDLKVILCLSFSHPALAS